MDDLITTFCGDCGEPLEYVRPGKWQCNNEKCLSNITDWDRLNDKEYLQRLLDNKANLAKQPCKRTE